MIYLVWNNVYIAIANIRAHHSCKSTTEVGLLLSPDYVLLTLYIVIN